MANRFGLVIALLGAGCRYDFEPARAIPSDGLLDGAPDGGLDGVPPCAMAPSGLLAYWSMDGSDVVAGNVMDRSGHGRNGKLMGAQAPVVSGGRIGEALDYTSAIGGYVDVPSITFGGAPGAATTIVLWYRRSGPLARDVLSYLPVTSKYDLWLDTNGGRTYLCINTGDGECWGIQDDGLLDRWVHVAAIFRNGLETTSELYVDGQARTLACQFGACETHRTVRGPVELGGSDVYAFRGLLDDVRIYDRALTAPEIGALFAGTACMP